MHTLNAAMFLEDAAQRAGDKPFLLTGQQPVTFGQVEENARRAARWEGWLRPPEQGAGPGGCR